MAGAVCAFRSANAVATRRGAGARLGAAPARDDSVRDDSARDDSARDD